MRLAIDFGHNTTYIMAGSDVSFLDVTPRHYGAQIARHNLKLSRQHIYSTPAYHNVKPFCYRLIK